MAEEPTTDEQSGTPEGEETFTYTQSELNTLLAEHKRNLRAENEELKSKVTNLDSLTQERDLLKGERDTLAGERDARATEALKLRVSLEKGLPVALVDRLRGSSQEELEADADQLLSLVKTNPSGFDGGAKTPAPKSTDPNSWFVDHLTKRD